MKKKRLKVILIFVVLVFFNINLFALENVIIAKIGNKTISSYDLKNKIRTSLILSDQEINQVNINKIKRLSLSSLINLRLKELEVLNYNVSIDQKQIIDQLNVISSDNITSLKQKFKLNNLDYKTFLSELEIELKWQKLIFSLYSKKVKIDDNNVQKNIEKIILENKKIKQYKLLEIEILINDQTNIETLNKEIQDFIKQSNFKEAAKKFSISPTAKDGGNLGWIDSISLSKEMFSMVDKMKIGEISQPIKKFNTVSFYKVSDTREADKNIDLEKIRKNFIDLQKNELFKLYSNSHLSKKKNNTFIELK